MKSVFRKFAPALAALVILGSAATSRADFRVRVSEDGFATYHELTQPTGGVLTLTGVYAETPDFDFSGFTVTSNSPSLSALSFLTASGTINYVGAGGHTLMIRSTDNTYMTPVGTVYTLRSSESYTEVDTNVGDSYKFQSFADPADAEFGMTVPSPGFTFASIGGTGAGSHNELPTLFATGVPFSLTNQVDYFATVTGSVFQPTGTSSVTARTPPVPEPGSMILMGMGIVGVAGMTLRRRRISAAATK